jgi:hypothetical protein
MVNFTLRLHKINQCSINVAKPHFIIPTCLSLSLSAWPVALTKITPSVLKYKATARYAVMSSFDFYSDGESHVKLRRRIRVLSGGARAFNTGVPTGATPGKNHLFPVHTW